MVSRALPPQGRTEAGVGAPGLFCSHLCPQELGVRVLGLPAAPKRGTSEGELKADSPVEFKQHQPACLMEAPPPSRTEAHPQFPDEEVEGGSHDQNQGQSGGGKEGIADWHLQRAPSFPRSGLSL